MYDTSEVRLDIGEYNENHVYKNIFGKKKLIIPINYTIKNMPFREEGYLKTHIESRSQFMESFKNSSLINKHVSMLLLELKNVREPS